jgi:hypothetical protein
MAGGELDRTAVVRFASCSLVILSPEKEGRCLEEVSPRPVSPFQVGRFLAFASRDSSVSGEARVWMK